MPRRSWEAARGGRRGRRRWRGARPGPAAPEPRQRRPRRGASRCRSLKCCRARPGTCDWRGVGKGAGARRPRRGPARRARPPPATRTSAAGWLSRRGRAGTRRPSCVTGEEEQRTDTAIDARALQASRLSPIFRCPGPAGFPRSPDRELSSAVTPLLFLVGSWDIT